MKNLIGLLMLSMVLILVACGDSEKETNKKKIESVTSEQKEADTENDKQDINQEVANTENIKATLISIEKVVDREWNEEKYEVKFEVENKRDDKILIQADKVSADGKMIDNSKRHMNTNISAGKKADAILTIERYGGSLELPEINEDFEMVLLVYTDGYEEMENHKVVHKVVVEIR